MAKLKSESGRTMLEMLGVLAIMGVIMYGAVAGIGFGVDVYKVNATFNDLENLAQGVIDIYSWSPSGYREVNVCTLGENDVFDSSLNVSGAGKDCSVTMRMGAITRIFASTTPSALGSCPPDAMYCGYFVFRYNAIPKYACDRLSNMRYANLVVDLANSSCDADPAYLYFRSR